MRLLYYANKARVKTDSGWDFPEWFPVPQVQLLADMGIKDRHKLYKIQHELISSRFIEVSQSKGREFTRYHLTLSSAESPAQNCGTIKKHSTFNTDEFFMAAVRSSFGDDFDMEILNK